MVADIPLDQQRPAEYVFEGLVKRLSEAEARTGKHDRAA